MIDTYTISYSEYPSIELTRDIEEALNDIYNVLYRKDYLIEQFEKEYQKILAEENEVE